MREYYERFPVVEVQQTFYEPPGKSTLLRWRESAPQGFEFTLKAWQLITHEATSSTYRRLKRPLTAGEKSGCGAFRSSPIVREAWAKTVECAAVLRASSVLFQCPASFRPTPDNLERMKTFFQQTERDGLRFLWEPRGPDWPLELAGSLCRELDLIHVVDPFVNATTNQEFKYFRLHGISGSRHTYSDEELRRLEAMTSGADVAYVMFNNLPRDNDSARFMRMLGKG